MKKWLLIYDDGDPLESKAKVSVYPFTSGDGDQPEPGDLSAAVESFADALDSRPDHDKIAVILVPFESARTISYRRGEWRPYAEGNIA